MISKSLGKPNLWVKCSHSAHATEWALDNEQSVKNSAVTEYTTWCKNSSISSHSYLPSLAQPQILREERFYTNCSSSRLYLYYLYTWDLLGWLKPEGGAESIKTNWPDAVAVSSQDTPWRSCTMLPCSKWIQKKARSGAPSSVTVGKYMTLLHGCSANKSLSDCCLPCIHPASCSDVQLGKPLCCVPSIALILATLWSLQGASQDW